MYQYLGRDVPVHCNIILPRFFGIWDRAGVDVILGTLLSQR